MVDEPAGLRVEAILRNDQITVRLMGELDLASVPVLEAELTRLIQDGNPVVVVDLTALTFCDSTGIGMFVRAHGWCRGRGGELRLAAPSPTVRRVFATVGMYEGVPTYETVDAALGGGPSKRITA